MILGGGADAATLRWTTGTMSQAQETAVAVAAPDAAGWGRGRLDTDTGALSWKVEYSGLTGEAMMMHFHGAAPPGASAGIQVNIGDLSGLASGTSGSTTIDATQMADFLAGLWYVNVHTMANMAGEIRGQVSTAPVPLPAALPLALAGVAAFGALRLRRRRA
ncbi:CHRD domain-containing protein [Amaricoccus sp.]|uniref:CHRD domain-containing protein n=1 Tax=Amaricoccus sp. TaxID=1872485 RepID=UPI001B69F13E|nr:CHRD domain-containing protein [Amaricoccus sp.]MBP7002631.1 CHRD domain-containing protein [Amaricoccus sp.]